MKKVLVKDCVPGPIARIFYQVVGMVPLLYSSKSGVLPPSVLNVLLGFHVEAMWRLTGMWSQKVRGVMSISHIFPLLGFRPTPPDRVLHCEEEGDGAEDNQGLDPAQGVSWGRKASLIHFLPILAGAGL